MYEVSDFWWVPIALGGLAILVVAVAVLWDVWKNR